MPDTLFHLPSFNRNSLLKNGGLLRGHLDLFGNLPEQFRLGAGANPGSNYRNLAGHILLTNSNTNWVDVTSSEPVVLSKTGSTAIATMSPGRPGIWCNGSYSSQTKGLFDRNQTFQYLTIGFWVAANNTGSQEGIWSQGVSPTDTSAQRLVAIRSGNLQFYGASGYFDTGLTLSPRKWFHVIASYIYVGGSYASQVVKWYANGNQIVSTTVPNFGYSGVSNLHLGSGYNAAFTGGLANFTVLPRGITDEQARLWYQWESDNQASIAYYTPSRRKVFSGTAPAVAPTPQIIVKKPEPPAPTTSNPYDWELDKTNPINKGLVGAWCPSLGPSGSRLLDKSGNANHGTLTNMNDTKSWVSSGGKLGLNFDGVDDYINVGDILGGLSNISISSWVYLRSIPGVGSTSAIVSKWGNEQSFDASDSFVLNVGTNQGFRFYLGGPNDGITTGSSAVQVNIMFHVCCTYNGSIARIFLQGIQNVSKAISGSLNISSGINLRFGKSQASALSVFLDALIDDIRIYNRALSASEVFQLYRGGRGYGYKPRQRVYAVPQSVAPINVYTLTADKATFTLTGIAAGLTRQLKLTADTGSFALTGNATGLTRQLKMTASVGSFTETGIAVGLTQQKKLATSTGAFTETGIDAGLTVARKLVVSTGSFTETGIDAGLTRQKKMAVTVGSFNLTGLDVGFKYDRILTAIQGSYSLLANDSILAWGRLFSVTKGQFELTGISADLSKQAAIQIPPHPFVGGNISYVVKSQKATAYVVKKQTGERYIG